MITCKIQMKAKIVNELLSNLDDNPSTEDLLQAVDNMIKEVLPELEEIQFAVKCAKSLRTELARQVQIAAPKPAITKSKDKTVNHQISLH